MACLADFHYIVRRAVKLHQGAQREDDSGFVDSVRAQSGPVWLLPSVKLFRWNRSWIQCLFLTSLYSSALLSLFFLLLLSFSLISFFISSRYLTSPYFSSSYTSSFSSLLPTILFFCLNLQFLFIFFFVCIKVYFILTTFHLNKQHSHVFLLLPLFWHEIQFSFVSCNNTIVVTFCAGHSLSDILLVYAGSCIRFPWQKQNKIDLWLIIWGRVSSVDIVIRCVLDDTGPARLRYFPPKSSDPFLGPTQPPVQLGTTVILSRVKTVCVCSRPPISIYCPMSMVRSCTSTPQCTFITCLWTMSL